jgi:hypothetical protein
MHEALCRPSDTTLDILHVERRPADHSANMGSRQPAAVGATLLIAAETPPLRPSTWIGVDLMRPLKPGPIMLLRPLLPSWWQTGEFLAVLLALQRGLDG